jgi:putative hydrolase of HD superfamily
MKDWSYLFEICMHRHFIGPHNVPVWSSIITISHLVRHKIPREACAQAFVDTTIKSNMVKMTVEEMSDDGLIQFSLRIGRLKLMPRSGWISQVGIDSPESVADHTFRCALLGMCIGDMLKLDTEQLIKMLLLHDVQESITGDLDHFNKQELGIDNVLEVEKKAIIELLSHLPAPLEADYLSLWKEFNNQESLEAVVAKDIDKLEMILQCLEYERKGYDPEKLASFWKNVEEQIKNPTLKKLFYSIRSLRTE